MISFLRVLLFIGVAGMVSCSPKISTHISKSFPALDYRQEIVVLGVSESYPDDSEILGTVKITDNGFSMNCGYDVIIEKATLEARKAGGNVLKIIEHLPPSALGSSCHQIKAMILNVSSLHVLKTQQEEPDIPGIDYAVLNVYRPNGSGFLVGYDLFLGNMVLCRVTNNSKTTISITKTGLNTLWAKTECKAEVPVNFQPGKTYYLRCGITNGFMVGHPKLELVDGKTGKIEFQTIQAKN